MEKDEFSQKIKSVSKRVAMLKDSLKNEEATKNSLIMPFFQVLGYDIFNPLEFIPEYTADVGIKKGERVDYAIVINGKLQILVEAKTITEDLNNHDSQLFRYFGTTDAKFGILTNGDEYRFFTDLEDQNKMDSEPFLTVKLSALRDNQITELFRFAKENFDEDSISSSASQLKYTTQFKEYLTKEMKVVDEDFARFILQTVFNQRATQANIEVFSPIIKAGFNQAIQEQVSDKLSSALNTSVGTASIPDEVTNAADTEEAAESEIVTTPAEIEAYTIVKLVLKDYIDESRVFYRDNKSYFNVLIDDNIRRWVVRVFFNNSKSWIQLNDESKDTLEFTHPIDIYNYSDQIVQTFKNLNIE
ncbi:type I restriction endonuclease [Lacticaseibacillus saniviri]